MGHNYFLDAKKQGDVFLANCEERQENVKKAPVMFFYMTERLVKESEETKEDDFKSLLEKKNLAGLKRYLGSHRLKAEDEVFMLITLVMETEDEVKAEKFIVGYIRSYGLRSLKAYQVLVDLELSEAIKAYQHTKTCLADDEPAGVDAENGDVSQKLYDGYRLIYADGAESFCNDLGLPLAIHFYGEAVSA